MRSGTTSRDGGDGLVGGFGRAELVGAQQVRHDAEHPLHQGLALHADTGELLHQLRLADHVGEGRGDAEVQPVLRLQEVAERASGMAEPASRASSISYAAMRAVS